MHLACRVSRMACCLRAGSLCPTTTPAQPWRPGAGGTGGDAGHSQMPSCRACNSWHGRVTPPPPTLLQLRRIGPRTGQAPALALPAGPPLPLQPRARMRPNPLPLCLSGLASLGQARWVRHSYAASCAQKSAARGASVCQSGTWSGKTLWSASALAGEPPPPLLAHSTVPRALPAGCARQPNPALPPPCLPCAASLETPQMGAARRWLSSARSSCCAPSRRQ